MSGVKATNYLLSNDATTAAIAPAERVITGDIPVGTTLPAVGVKQISATERLTVRQEASAYRTDRVQVTAVAKTYAEVRALLEAARAACSYKRGVIGGVKVDSILPDGEGPDLSDPDSNIYQQSRDFLVSWISP